MLDFSGKRAELPSNLMRLGEQLDTWSMYLREQAHEMRDEHDFRLLRVSLQAIAGGLSYAASEARRAARS